ncbi:hypothetical protein ACFVZ3_12345, partial [Kitasatospora purpeofusca]|uniref:hypothetical protein n=1 Tax=Kitasatospora purpeofusca TaxID=67352 RepID=UPI00367DC6D4
GGARARLTTLAFRLRAPGLDVRAPDLAAEALGHVLWSARLREWRALALEAAGRPAAARLLVAASLEAYTAAASGSDTRRLTGHLERLADLDAPPPHGPDPV